MAVIGLGDAGYGVLRALAFEHRFAAAVAYPGIVDASTPCTQLLPDTARWGNHDASGEHNPRGRPAARVAQPSSGAPSEARKEAISVTAAPTKARRVASVSRARSSR